MQAEQLAAIGALAAGVAHEINNPINGIINYAQIIIDKERDLHKIQDISERIVKEGDRIARIVASLLSYARRGIQEETTASVEELVTESLTLIGAQMKKEAIALDVRFAEHLPPVFCVPQEIQQVFLNIISNARDAMNRKFPENDGDKRLEIFADVDEIGWETLGSRRLSRQRHRHFERHPRQDHETILLHQTEGKGHRARPQHQPRHRGRERRRADHRK